MALQYTVRPISDRTPFTGKHQASKFLVRWADVLDLLDREYWFLGGKNLVIEVDVPETGIRNDGMLRADARAASPAVRIAFESKFGPLVYATDRFVRTPGRHYVGKIPDYQSGQKREQREQMPDWQHNVYAIAKSLEALRMVDRYGVTKRGEQYTGWKALPPGTGVAPTGMTVELAIEVLYDESTEPRCVGSLPPERPGRAELAAVLRAARACTHPDRNGGDRARWNAVDEAEQVLRRAGRL